VKTDARTRDLFCAGGELKGKLSSDGKTINGSWTQGTSLPLTLTRKAAAAAH
jgi:hypothetical protein